jgi:hypothetical protein
MKARSRRSLLTSSKTSSAESSLWRRPITTTRDKSTAIWPVQYPRQSPLVIVDPTWTHTVLTNPGAYSADALTTDNAAATREQYVAQHKVKQKSYNNYLSVKEVGKELILYAVGEDAIAPPQEAIHWFRQHGSPQDDRTSSPQNGNQNDNGPEV